ncbi:MAG: hypothetical protein EKK29_18190 [Hyphomicrobiales bacterium]|nr:MAG: hypothetical protein EKK29_18190 [Hyphomicrobiales bacterium]
MHPETKASQNASLARKTAAENAVVSFTAATAKATGKAERTIRLAAARGKARWNEKDANENSSLAFTESTSEATGEDECPAQEAHAIARRKAIYEELHPETKATYEGGTFKGNQHAEKVVGDNLSFVSTTSEATGKDRRTIERAAARGKALGDDLDAVAGTSLDKGVELDALAKMGEEERKPIIERAKAGERA